MERTSRSRHLERAAGFTLIELMVTVAIVAILAAIAIPSYSQYTQKTRRADAKTALLRAVSQAEKYFLNNGSYPTAASPGTAALGAMGIPALSENGYYQIRYEYDGSAITVGNPRFNAVATGVQAKDLDCRTFQIGLTGVRSAFSAPGGAGTTTDVCW